MDDEWLRRARNGDGYAFEMLAAPHENAVYQLCLSMMGHTADAADCAQEAFLKAFRGLRHFQGGAQFSTWMHRIAHNVCVDALRKRKPELSVEALDEEGIFFVSAASGPYEALEKRERQALLSRAFNALPEVNRAALLLHIQGLEYGDIACVTGVPEGTVKSRIHRARERLKAFLCADRELFSDSSVQDSDRRCGS
jgi:RNA polymerase sigma-70 factor (ECF subfamily)